MIFVRSSNFILLRGQIFPATTSSGGHYNVILLLLRQSSSSRHKAGSDVAVIHDGRRVDDAASVASRCSSSRHSAHRLPSGNSFLSLPHATSCDVQEHSVHRRQELAAVSSCR